MDRKSRTLALVLILIGLTSLTLIPHTTVKAQTRTLVVPDQYPTIQSAIGNASMGDTVVVKKGTYQESNLIVDKAISIIGEDRESTNIIGQANPYMFLVNQSKATISGLTLIASSTKQPTVSTSQYQKEIVAIQIEQSQNCNISGNKIVNSGNGVWLHSSSNNLIERNKIKDNYYGIDITGYSTRNLIRNNDISYSQVGIRFSDKNVNNTIVSANNISSAYTGLFYYFTSQNYVVGNYIASNNDATHFVGSQNNVLNHNNFVDNLRDISKESAHYDNIMVTKSINFWDDKQEGNYWDKYNGTANDGVGSIPYTLNEFNQDNHPLLTSIDVKDFVSYSERIMPYPTATPPYSDSIYQTPTNTPINKPSTSPMPSPSVPEFSMLAVISLILSLFFIAVVLRHRKTANLKQ